MIDHKEMIQLTDKMDALLAEHKVPGVSYGLFDEQQQVCFSAGKLGAQASSCVNDKSLFHACSMSKLVTSLMVLKLVDSGVLNLDQPINEYLKHWQLRSYDPSLAQTVALATLLNHTSGIQDHPDGFIPLHEGDDIPSLLTILSGTSVYNPKPIEQDQAVGEFSYSDAGFCLIEYVLGEVSGKSFPSLADELIFTPLGLTGSLFEHPSLFCQSSSMLKVKGIDSLSFAFGHNKQGDLIKEKRATYPYLASAGQWSNATDLTKLLIGISQGLKGKGELGISSHLLKRMITPQSQPSWAGLGVFLQGDANNKVIFSMGWGVGFQCKLVCNVSKGSGAIVLTNSDPGCDQDNALTGEIIRALKKIISFDSL